MFSAENIVVLGAGKSGVGAAVLAQKKEKCICFRRFLNQIRI